MIVILMLHLIRIVFTQDMTTDALGGIAFDELPKNNTIDEGQTLEEEWVRDAILDLAYYIRSHKYNEFDRRYKTEESGEGEFYKKFPEPPLRSFHWEVSKFCSVGLVECLRYANEITSKVKIGRNVDTAYKIFRENWTLSKNKKKIEKATETCKKIFKQDWESGEPFQGPIEKFQWRTTMSYYMCRYTLQGNSVLAAFGERCDNHANCVWSESTGDPRADDNQPYACAKYSFCPDPCCPKKTIPDSAECHLAPGNPCPNESVNRTCSIPGEQNLDLRSLSLNHWNFSCSCNENGHIFDSRFGICVDIDECEAGSYSCNNETETCLNLRGSYGCVCLFGHRWDLPKKSCIPIKELTADIKPSNFILKEDEKQNGSRFWKRGENTKSKGTHEVHVQNFQVIVLLYLFLFIY